MGSQRVGHDWATELNWVNIKMIDETVGLLSSTFSVFHTYSTSNSHSLRFKRSVAICRWGVTTWFREAAEDFQSQKRPTPDAIDDALLPDGTPWTEIAAERKLRVCARSRRRRSRELAGREDSPRQEAGLSGLRKVSGARLRWPAPSPVAHDWG